MKVDFLRNNFLGCCASVLFNWFIFPTQNRFGWECFNLIKAKSKSVGFSTIVASMKTIKNYKDCDGQDIVRPCSKNDFSFRIKFDFNWIFAGVMRVMRSHWVPTTAVMNITQSGHFLLDHNYCCPRSECLANHNLSQTRNGNHLIWAPAQPRLLAWCCLLPISSPSRGPGQEMGTRNDF